MKHSVKTLIVNFVFLLVGIEAYSQDCFKTFKKREANLSFCIDTLMGIDQMDASVVNVRLYSKINEEHKVDTVGVYAEVNSQNYTAKEIWTNWYKALNHKVNSHKDSVFELNGNQVYLVQEEVKEGEEIVKYSTAIVMYKSMFFVFDGHRSDLETSLPKLLKVLSRTSFEGEPKLVDKNILKMKVEQSIISILADDENVKEEVITLSFMKTMTPPDERDNFEKEAEQMMPLLQMWHTSVFEFRRYLNECKKRDFEILIQNVENNDDYGSMVMYSITTKCGDEVKVYRAAAMYFHGQLKLGRIVGQ